MMILLWKISRKKVVWDGYVLPKSKTTDAERSHNVDYAHEDDDSNDTIITTVFLQLGHIKVKGTGIGFEVNSA